MELVGVLDAGRRSGFPGVKLVLNFQSHMLHHPPILAANADFFPSRTCVGVTPYEGVKGGGQPLELAKAPSRRHADRSKGLGGLKGSGDPSAAQTAGGGERRASDLDGAAPSRTVLSFSPAGLAIGGGEGGGRSQQGRRLPGGIAIGGRGEEGGRGRHLPDRLCQRRAGKGAAASRAAWKPARGIPNGGRQSTVWDPSCGGYDPVHGGHGVDRARVITREAKIQYGINKSQELHVHNLGSIDSECSRTSAVNATENCQQRMLPNRRKRSRELKLTILKLATEKLLVQQQKISWGEGDSEKLQNSSGGLKSYSQGAVPNTYKTALAAGIEIFQPPELRQQTHNLLSAWTIGSGEGKVHQMHCTVKCEQSNATNPSQLVRRCVHILAHFEMCALRCARISVCSHPSDR
ncbi:hypothetical protein KSP40_PGU018798 [Platanthera guangdongensis]|uniref:Uncharacterized protein n=1 Tax=Platanthera guangdongensis TaxID=2320717 RepID=A0ABR2MC72_9ASPA